MNVPGAGSPRLSWVDDHKTTLLLLYSVTYTVMEVGFNRLLTDSVAGSVAATTWKSAQRDANTARWLYKLSEIFPPSPQTPFSGAQDAKIWRWLLPAPTDPVWWSSMHAISSYRRNRRRLPAKTQTGPITIHCAAG